MCDYGPSKTAKIFSVDHTTCIHAKKVVYGQMKSRQENKYKRDIDNLIYSLNESATISAPDGWRNN
jgi:hypothetical protein